MKKVAFKVNTNAEKTIVVTALSAIRAGKTKQQPEARKLYPYTPIRGGKERIL